MSNPEFRRREVVIFVGVAFAAGALLGQCGEADVSQPVDAYSQEAVPVVPSGVQILEELND